MVPPDYHWEKVQRILEGDDMTDKDVIQALRCCADGECKDCAMHEDKQRCQENLLDKAADLIERLTAESADLRKEIEWKGMVIALAQKEQAKAEAERDALREKQRWIPVTERLPERDVQVLGWYKDNPFSQYRPEVVAWNGNGWVFVYAHRYVTNVTHWMPLPKAPEDGNT